MVELPRVTRALRAHTQLEKQRQLKPEHSHKLHLPKNKLEKFRSFNDICNYVRSNERNYKDLLELILKLKECCKKLALDQTNDILEDATVIVLRMFLDRKLLIQDTIQLRLLFGDVSTNVTNEIWEIVSKISREASDEAKDFMKKETAETENDRIELWGESIPFHNEPFEPTKKPLAKLNKTPAAISSKFLNDFSMKYVKKEDKKLNKKPQSALPVQDSKYNKTWLEKEMRKLFPEGEERHNYLNLVLKYLHSSQNNDEMQSELLDTLGFDKIEFIQDLLVHRKEIVWSLNNQEQPPVNPSPSVPEIPEAYREERMPEFLCQVSVMTESDKRLEKDIKKAMKKRRVPNRGCHNMNMKEEEEVEELTHHQLLLKMRIRSVFESIRKAQAPPTIPVLAGDEEENVLRMSRFNTVRYPHVYDSMLDIRNVPKAVSGLKFHLPVNAVRNNLKEYEEIILPKNDPPPLNVGNKRVQICDLDEIGQMAFENVKELNRIQSIVFQTAYNTNENLLIAAPTGAGKTNVALLAVVHQIKQHIENGIIMKNKFKIIYITPMKALAAEMTANFGKRLQSLGIMVRELTGDMKLTKWEIQQTQMIVTTPEKWDIVTRKGASDTELAAIVKLLIIDEVHLLHGDRGPIVEAIVARTLRQVESTQNMIRIVGLSATLPNYVDVARFLRVNPNIGLFYFDHRFRPVPLEQEFIGIKDTGSGGGAHIRQMNAMNEVCYSKAAKMIKQGHQVMIFVHARNATHQTAMIMKEIAQSKDELKHFIPEDSADFMRAKKAIGSSPNKQLADLFASGFACHHAGMLRRDRNMVEKYFSEGYIRLLVCTSTLAWGVNLPAHCVIIKGTELYDESKGKFVDLSILDVLQIFGRAGRPQFDTSGTGIIITTHNKLNHYITAITHQVPIESSFYNLLADNLNAEIALGTVTNIDEAVNWLSYTYLYVRLKLVPHVYGISYSDIQNEGTINNKLRESIIQAAMELDKTRMIRYDERSGDLHTTNLGRTASHYYITCETMKVFNEVVGKIQTQADILQLLSRCSDFQNIKVRKEELSDIHSLAKQYCEWPVDSKAEDHLWKINVLLQVYLSRGRVNASSLQSDMNYISQNVVRVVRALFEIALRKNEAYMSAMFLRMAKMLELQLWDFNSDMRQFNCFSEEVLKHIEYPNVLMPDQIREMDWKELGQLVRNPKAAQHLIKCAEEFPILLLDAHVAPITRTVLRIKLTITPDFKWSDKYHGKAPEGFWIFVEDPEHDTLYYNEYFLLTKKQVISKEPQEIVITTPVMEPMPPQYYIRATSERWQGSEGIITLTLNDLILPNTYPPHTELLCLQPVPVKSLYNPAYEALYEFSHFNPLQSQLFHSLYHRDCNILLGSATGSGKTIVAEIAMFKAFNDDPNCKVVYIAPMKALVKERIKDWSVRIEGKLGMKVVELTGDVSPDVRAIQNSRVIVTTPEKWDGISRSWQTRTYVRDVSLMIIDEIHLLGEDRGPVLEVIVSRANFIESHTSRRLRIVGMTTSMANAQDLADWLNIKDRGLYNFKAYCRPVPLQIHVSGFPGRHYCPRMMSMNKPTFQAIRTHSPTKPALIFVSSRRQTRLTALDLIAYLAAESNPKQWLHMQELEMEQLLSNIRDSNLKLTLAFGIGLHHAGLHEKDRSTVEELFVNQKIQVLVCTATLAWGVNFPAHLVVIKGTEYYDGKQKRYVDMPITDVLQMMGRAGRPQYDDFGVAFVLLHDQKKEYYRKFLYEPLPVESSLLEVLPDHLNAEIVAGTVNTKQEIMDYLTWTYFFRRLLENPTYYHLENLEQENINLYLSNLVQNSLDQLANAGCVEIEEDERSVHCTWMGRIASFYYLSYKTMAHFRQTLEYNTDFDTLLRLLSQCQEYATLPVRHNEDNLNKELAPLCRLPVDPLSLDAADVKTFLLLQAHLSRLTLPNIDYFTDTKSVLDQTIRIIQAMIDTSAENGYLATCLYCQTLIQCIIQARWNTDSPLTTLPNIEADHLYMFTQLSRDTGKPCTTLNGIKVATVKNYELLAKYLRKEFEEQQIEDIYQVICALPTIDVKISIRGLWQDMDQEQTREIRQPCDRNSWIPVHADQEYTLVVELTRRGGNPSNVHSPRFPKAKKEGWFLTLGTVEYGELHALKRVPPKGSSQLTFYTPSQTGRIIYTVYLLSDSYMGLDQQYDMQLEIIEPIPQEKIQEAYDLMDKTIIE